MKCPNCQEEVSAAQRRCSNCGVQNPGFEDPAKKANDGKELEELKLRVKTLEEKQSTKKTADDDAVI